MQVVLLGDSSHCISPVLGQGCNAGLEDCHVLGQVRIALPLSLSQATAAEHAPASPMQPDAPLQTSAACVQ